MSNERFVFHKYNYCPAEIQLSPIYDKKSSQYLKYTDLIEILNTKERWKEELKKAQEKIDSVDSAVFKSMAYHVWSKDK